MYSSGTLPTDRRFTGQRWEQGLGLYDYNARWYHPALGRFVSADTIMAEPRNPQSLNLYAYVQGNPLKYTDPSGHIEPERGMKKRTIGCIGLLFACLVLTFFYAAIYRRQKTRAQPVDMYDLMVDVSAFPQGWYIESGPSHPPQGKYLRGETESLFLQFIGLGGGAMHVVWRYDNDLEATVSFYVDNEFSKREAVVTPWAIPQG